MVILSRDLAGFRIDQMSLLACDTGDHLKGLTLVVIVFSVRLHIPAGTRAAKNESGHPALIFFRKSESFDLKQFSREYVLRERASNDASEARSAIGIALS